MSPNQQSSSTNLYDRIMGEIEPELTSAMAPTLATRYHDEPPPEAVARWQRYQKAFQRYHAALQQWHAERLHELKTMERSGRASLETMDRDIDELDLSSLTATMFTTA